MPCIKQNPTSMSSWRPPLPKDGWDRVLAKLAPATTLLMLIPRWSGLRNIQQSFNYLSLTQFCLLLSWSLFLSESSFLRSNTFLMKPGSTGDFFLMKEKSNNHMNCVSSNLEPAFISSFSHSQQSITFPYHSFLTNSARDVKSWDLYSLCPN